MLQGDRLGFFGHCILAQRLLHRHSRLEFILLISVLQVSSLLILPFRQKIVYIGQTAALSEIAHIKKRDDHSEVD